MKVFGFEDVGPYRGEMLATDVRPIDLDFGEALLAVELGWEYCSTRFADARKKLLAAMADAGVDEELVGAVKSIKAGDVPVV